MRVIAYTRASTQEQAESRAGLDAQRAALAAEAEHRGWEVEWVEDAGHSAKSLKRPGIQAALGRLAAGEADALAAAKLDRLSRSVVDAAGLIERAQREGWRLIVLDSPLDMSTPYGEAMASIQATFAQLERRLISQRTKDALAARRAAGVRLGRPRSITPEVEARIHALRAEGRTLAGICAELQAADVPTPKGGPWHVATVHRVLQRSAA